MFYTSIDQRYNRIFHSYYKDGKHHQEVVTDFPISLYLRSEKKDTVSIYCDSLGAIKFSKLRDGLEFIQENKHNEIFGQTNLLYQFLSHEYPKEINFDFSKIKILIFDIETDFGDSFPDPYNPTEEILTISVKVLNTDFNIVFGVKDYTGNKKISFVKCLNEKDLFLKFQKFWSRVSPTIISGWHIDGFDIPYLINRSINLLGYKFANTFSPFHKNNKECIRFWENKVTKEKEIEIIGITSLDYMKLYKQYAKPVESYRLDFVAQQELNEGKIDYSEYGNLMDLYEKNYNLYVEYNIRDSLLIERLEKKLNFILLVVTLSYLGKCRIQDVFHQVTFWDAYIYNVLKEKNIQIPPKKQNELIAFSGGYVKNPNPGLYSWITTLDLTSLYPSIIKGWNVSPETIKDSASVSIDKINIFIDMEKDTQFLKDENKTMLANGTTFDKQCIGVFPEIITNMLKVRSDIKKEMLQAKKMLEKAVDDVEQTEKLKGLIATLDAKQNSYKTASNSLYGASGSPYFRYFNSNIAEGITMTGQFIIRRIANKLNEFLNAYFSTNGIDYVIFSDTDSVGLNLDYLVKKTFKETNVNKETIVDFIDSFVNENILPFLKIEFEIISDYLNLYDKSLSIKRETITEKGLWRGKKNYILQVWDNEGVRYTEPKLVIKGIEVIKSSTPQAIRKVLRECILIILNEDESTLQRRVKEFKKEFLELEIADIAFPRGVSNMNKWMTATGFASGTPIHTRGAILYNQLVDNFKHLPIIRNGDKIKFCYLNPKNFTQSHVISFLTDLPMEFELHSFVDRELQFEKVFLEPLKSLTDLINWSIQKKRRLDF